jgi:AcrR family transcriptional regulator
LARVAHVFLTDFLLHYLRQQNLVLVHLPDRQGADAPIAAAQQLLDVQPWLAFSSVTRRTTRFPTSIVVLVTNILVMGKSEQTHSRLQQRALDLFAEYGFEATTVEQIARAAGVSEMTFFRHFPTKDAVVLDDPFDPQIAAAVAAQPGSLAPLARACRGLRQAIGALALPDQHQVRQRVRIVGQTPSLAGGVWANTAVTQEVLTSALAEDVAKPDARVAAAAVMGALTAALIDWGSRDDEQTLAVVLLRALDVLDAPAAGHGSR